MNPKKTAIASSAGGRRRGRDALRASVPPTSSPAGPGGRASGCHLSGLQPGSDLFLSANLLKQLPSTRKGVQRCGRCIDGASCIDLRPLGCVSVPQTGNTRGTPLQPTTWPQAGRPPQGLALDRPVSLRAWPPLPDSVQLAVLGRLCRFTLRLDSLSFSTQKPLGLSIWLSWLLQQPHAHP